MPPELLVCLVPSNSPGDAIPTSLSAKETLGLDGHVHENAETARAFTTKVDHILENHSGIGIKTLELLGAPTYNAKDRCYLDKWLQMAITPVLEELMLYFSPVNNKYEFPCLLLSHGNASSIRCLRLSNCTFGPTVGLGCSRSLSVLNLFRVHITEDELNYLEVLFCEKLRVMESRAPNLTDFTLHCHSLVQLSHLASSQMKSVCMGSLGCPGVIGYIHAKLASSVPNLQSLVIFSPKEMVDAPISNKFLHLKSLNIVFTRYTFSLSYDYLSLTSFLDASPSLETFILEVWQLHMEHVSASTDPSDPRDMPGHNHDKLKNVRIHGFSSTKSLIELTCHIVQIATSLQWLVLDTREGLALPDCSVNEIGECLSMPRESILEACRALVAVQTYIKPKVPSTV